MSICVPQSNLSKRAQALNLNQLGEFFYNPASAFPTDFSIKATKLLLQDRDMLKGEKNNAPKTESSVEVRNKRASPAHFVS